ncbi:hypothetical protein RDABS01_006570 [Bienertia sinuspersici]
MSNKTVPNVYLLQRTNSEGTDAIVTKDMDSRNGDKEETSEEKEDDSIEWRDDGEEEEEDRVALSLMGELWTKRSINNKAFMSTIKGVWQLKYVVDIRNIGKNKFLFQFYHWKDKNRVLEGQPWHFDKYALLLGEIHGTHKPSDINLTYMPIWARGRGAAEAKRRELLCKKDIYK